jgi:hypothetical protein
MDQPTRLAAVSPAHSTAMHLVSDSLADRQDERVPDGPLEFPVVIREPGRGARFPLLGCLCWYPFVLRPFVSRWGGGLPLTAEFTRGSGDGKDDGGSRDIGPRYRN